VASAWRWRRRGARPPAGLRYETLSLQTRTEVFPGIDRVTSEYGVRLCLVAIARYVACVFPRKS
jgi:hypothetical protein